MSLDIKSANELKRGHDFSALIYSAPGVGKTSTAKYLPGKTLVIDIDRTTNVLAGEENIDIVYLDTTQPFHSTKVLLKEIHDNHLDDYDNIFIDNLSEFENAWFGQKAKESKTKNGQDMGTPQMQDYNAYTYYILDMIRYINSWSGINKVYTAWEMQVPVTSSTGQTYNKFYPDVREKVLNGLLGLMNMVGRMVVNKETGNRGFLLNPSDDTYAKNQIDNREFALQSEIFEFGDADVQAT
jgi:phage nucleotide-binding protein